MEDVHDIAECRDIHHTKSAGGVTDTNFTNTWTNGSHAPPIKRIQSTLDPLQLEARLPPCLLGKLANAVPRITKKGNVFHYIKIDIVGKCDSAVLSLEEGRA